MRSCAVCNVCVHWWRRLSALCWSAVAGRAAVATAGNSCDSTFLPPTGSSPRGCQQVVLPPVPAAPLIPYTSRSMPSPLDPSASPPAFLPPTFAGGQRLAAADRAARGWGPGEAALGPTGYGGCVTRACGPVDCVAQLWVCACVCTSVSCVLVVAPCIACAGPAGRNGCGCAKVRPHLSRRNVQHSLCIAFGAPLRVVTRVVV